MPTPFRQVLDAILTENEDPQFDFETLKKIYAPVAGREAYEAIRSEERKLAARGYPEQKIDKPYIQPMLVNTKTPYGPTDKFGRVIPWRERDVLDAMTNYIRSRAKLILGGRDQGVWDLNDATQNGLMAVHVAIEEDQNRPNVSFVSYATHKIDGYIMNGVSDAGWSYRMAIGMLNDLHAITVGPPNQQMVDRIEGLLAGTEPSPKTGTPRKPLDSGEYRDQAGAVQQGADILLQSLRDAITTGNPAPFQQARQQVKKLKQEVEEQSKLDRIPGAHTSDTIRTSHKYDTEKSIEMKKQLRPKTMEVTSPKTGETVARSGIPYHPSDEGKVDQRELIGLVLRKAGLTAQQLRVIIRQHGYKHYPGQGTDADPELDPDSQSHLSMWATPDDEVFWYDDAGNAINGLGMREMDTNEIVQELGVSKARVHQLASAAMKRMHATVQDMMWGDSMRAIGDAFGVGESYDDIDRNLLREFGRQLRDKIIESVYHRPTIDE